MPPHRESYMHYATRSGNAICGAVNRDAITHRPPLVTCPKCMSSSAYKEMMDEDPL